jgi:hypothetical protein
MNEKTGEMPTLTAAASELGSRGTEGAVRSVANQMKEKTGKMPTLVAAAYEMTSLGGRRSQDSRRIGTRGCATENCENTVHYTDGHCKHCHDLLPKKLKAEFCIGVGGRVCGRVIERGNQCRKCSDHPDEKKIRAAKKAARPKCTINGCRLNELRSYGLCEKHYKDSVKDAKAKKIDRNWSRANFAEQQSTQ